MLLKRPILLRRETLLRLRIRLDRPYRRRRPSGARPRRRKSCRDVRSLPFFALLMFTRIDVNHLLTPVSCPQTMPPNAPSIRLSSRAKLPPLRLILNLCAQAATLPRSNRRTFRLQRRRQSLPPARTTSETLRSRRASGLRLRLLSSPLLSGTNALSPLRRTHLLPTEPSVDLDRRTRRSTDSAAGRLEPVSRITNRSRSRFTTITSSRGCEAHFTRM